MSDNPTSPKPSKASIPSWQLAHKSEQPKADEAKANQPPLEMPTTAPIDATAGVKDEPNEEPVLSGQAAKFLEDPMIKDASRERKAAFLQSKGVKQDDIERLLPRKSQSQASEMTEDEPRVVHSSSSSESKTTQQPTAVGQQARRRDVPPIVTYPEFMLQSTKPPPLVTTQRLMYTAYLTGGLAATMYGLSKHIIEPMTETLTAARHEFLAHSASHVDDLNSRLEKAVSTLPSELKRNSKSLISDQDEEPPSPTDSDPTELFHRDIGTQTSPTLSRRQSKTSLSSSEANGDTTNHQESRLKSLKDHVSDLSSSSEAHQVVASDLNQTVGDLSSYLTEMSYSSPYYSYGYGALDGRGVGSFTNNGDNDAKKKEDAIDALKAEIRGVKGVLLSARNFPASRPMGTR